MDLTNALWITLIGMGLVFIAILMLWGLMALLVRLTAEREPAAAAARVPPAAVEALPVDDVSELAVTAAQALERKRRAAAAAVAYALSARAAKNGRTARAQEVVSSGELSPWQAVNRAGRISQQVTSRKKVVR